MAYQPQRVATLAIVLAGFAAPAFAQQGPCGGSIGSGQWIGGNEASSDISTVENYQEQMALVMGGNEYVALFSLSEPTDVRVEAAGRGSGDPIIDLLDSTGGVILSDDDSGGDAAARAETSLDAGTYCMSLRSYDGGPMTAFVRIARTDQQPLTDGIETSGPENIDTEGSCAQARPIGPIGTSVSASASETPYWSFTLDTPTAVSITASNEDADPTVTLYDANDTYIDENDDYDGLNAQLDVAEPLDPGTYCIGVAALNDNSLPITVSVTEYDAEAAMLALFARGEAAPPLDGSIPFTDLGVLETRVRQDVRTGTETTWYTVDLDDSSLLVVEAIGSAGSDPWLVVYDDLGRQVGQNDDYGEGLDSLVMARVERGTYIVGVKQYEDSPGFIRLLLERYVRAQ